MSSSQGSSAAVRHRDVTNATLTGGARKLIIKNRRAAPSIADEDAKVERYFAKTWADLKVAMSAVLIGEPLMLPMDRLFRGVEGICRDGKAGLLNKELTEFLQEHLKRVVLVDIQRGAEGEGLEADLARLRGAVTNWNLWKERTRLVRSMFSYMDRSYLLREKMTQLKILTTTLFRRILFHSSMNNESADGKTSKHVQLGISVLRAICQLIDDDRYGRQSFDSQLLKDSISMLHMLDVYTKYFERDFLHKSTNYFKSCRENTVSYSLKEYAAGCKTLLKSEEDRCDLYTLNGTSRERLREEFYKEMVQTSVEKFLEPQSFGELCDDMDMATLKIIYDFLQGGGDSLNTDFLTDFGTPWRQYILSDGATVIKTSDLEDTIVPSLLALRRKLTRIVQQSFHNNSSLVHILRDAFGSFLNDRNNYQKWRPEGVAKIGEFTAKYMDSLLRNGIRAIPVILQEQDSIENVGGSDDVLVDFHLDQSLELFRLIQGKDAFEAFYKRDLARRLLMDRSFSYDSERSMLARLRGECGANFTHNLENMFREKELNKDEMQSFQTWISTKKKKPSVPLHVLVISSAAWPTYPHIKPRVPSDIVNSISIFEEYYKSKHYGRHLDWNFTLGYCVLTAHFKRGTRELYVSILQALVLLLFNDVSLPSGENPGSNALSCSQIGKETDLPADDLSRTLQSLACGNYRVLNKHPKSRDVKETDIFTFNVNFYEPRFKIKINQIQAKVSKQEIDGVHERIVEDRKMEIQAAVVRLMKSRQRIRHSVLVAETIKLIANRGAVDTQMIKAQIEVLMEKDYMERDEEDDNAYVYVA